METSLQESEELYRTLIESSLEAVSLNQDGKFLLVNEAFCNLFGYSKEEIFGMNPPDFIAPEDRERVMEIHYKRMRGDMNTMHYTANFLHKTGRRILTELNASTVQVNGRNASFITMSDITERNRFEQELKKSEQKYRELTEMLPLTVYELDSLGNPTYINKAGRELFGLNKENAGNNAMSFFVADDRERMENILKNEQQNAENVSENTDINPSDPAEYTVQKPDGSTIPVLIYGTAIIENGKPVGSRGVIVDISERKAMENALRESEEKYKTLIENSQDGIFAIIDDRIVFANNTFCRMVGYTPKELYNKSAVSLVCDDDKERGLAINERRKQGDRSTVNDIFRFLAKDGSIKEADVFSSVLELSGQVVSYITVHDLTETRRIQEALTKSEQKYRELSEMLPQTVYELDLNANLKYLNKAGREKFGTAYETSNISVFSIVVPEDLERMKNNFMNVSFKSIPSKGNFYKLRQADGQIFEAMISATPMIVDGKTIGQRGVVIDITDHVNMQKALKESEEKYRTVIENATDGIVITQHGKLMFLNESMCNMVKYTKEELIGISFLDIVLPEHHQIMIDFHKRRMAGEEFTALYRSRIIRKDGKILTIELNARTSNYNGSPAAFIVIRDISDRIKIEEELQIAKSELEKLNSQLEKRVKESSKRLTEARTQLINSQKENLQSQYDVLKQQVNPHFLFNSLNVLTSLIKLEPDLAEKFSEQLSKVYRYVLENKDNELVD
jgi:PAS domain S-box-containing protein